MWNRQIKPFIHHFKHPTPCDKNTQGSPFQWHWNVQRSTAGYAHQCCQPIRNHEICSPLLSLCPLLFFFNLKIYDYLCVCMFMRYILSTHASVYGCVCVVPWISSYLISTFHSLCLLSICCLGCCSWSFSTIFVSLMKQCNCPGTSLVGPGGWPVGSRELIPLYWMTSIVTTPGFY